MAIKEADTLPCPHCGKDRELFECNHDEGKFMLCETCKKWYEAGLLDSHLVRNIVTIAVVASENIQSLFCSSST